MSEKRNFIRIPNNDEVRIRPLDNDELAQGEVKNISGSGILISSPVYFEPGKILDIEVYTPTHKDLEKIFDPLRARIRVIRILGDKAPYEIAGEFVSLNLP